MIPKVTATAVIVGTVLILLLPSAVFATKDGSGSSTFKVHVYGSGINSDTGELFTEVILESGASESDTLIPGDTGRVFLGQFVFDKDEVTSIVSSDRLSTRHNLDLNFIIEPIGIS